MGVVIEYASILYTPVSRPTASNTGVRSSAPEKAVRRRNGSGNLRDQMDSASTSSSSRDYRFEQTTALYRAFNRLSRGGSHSFRKRGWPVLEGGSAWCRPHRNQLKSSRAGQCSSRSAMSDQHTRERRLLNPLPQTPGPGVANGWERRPYAKKGRRSVHIDEAFQQPMPLCSSEDAPWLPSEACLQCFNQSAVSAMP